MDAQFRRLELNQHPPVFSGTLDLRAAPDQTKPAVGLEPTGSALRERHSACRASPATYQGWPVGVEPTQTRFTAGPRCRFGFGHSIPGRIRTCSFRLRRAACVQSHSRDKDKSEIRKSKSETNSKSEIQKQTKQKYTNKQFRGLESNQHLRVQSPSSYRLDNPGMSVIPSPNPLPRSTGGEGNRSGQGGSRTLTSCDVLV